MFGLSILVSSQRLSVLKHCPLGIYFFRKTTCMRMRVCIKVVKLCFILHSATMVGQQFTPEERTFMVLLYHETGSPARTIEAFVRQFPNRHPPTRRTILRNFLKYQNHRTSHNHNKGNSGRPKSARTQPNIDAVQHELNDNPEASAQ